MSLNAFIKFDTLIKGETTQKGNDDGWIKITSYDVGVDQSKSPVAASGGSTNAQASFEDFTFTKTIDLASALLMQECAKGTHFATVEFHLYRAGGEDQMTLIQSYKFGSVIIKSWDAGGAGDEVSGETVKLAFGKIYSKYNAVSNDVHAESGNGVGGYDLEGKCVWAG